MVSVLSADSVAIVGAGALGTALAHAFRAAGVPVAAVASLHRERAEALAEALGGVEAVDMREATLRAPVVILAVSDSAIEAACDSLHASAGVLVAHTSGSRDVSTLVAARAGGAVVGGFHPLAAVVPMRAAQPAAAWRAMFDGAAFAIEGAEGVTERLMLLATALGGQPFVIRGADKPLYHLGASMLAAFSAGLAQIAWQQMRAAGASAQIASAGVGHLLATVAHNVGGAATPASALTGPVARGDAGGVRRQAETARGLSLEAQALYRAHATHNIRLALEAGRIDHATAASLTAALAAPND